MTDKLHEDSGKQVTIFGMSEESFDKLNDEHKTYVLASFSDTKNKDKDGGIFGKLFGTNINNAAIHIALVIVLILLVYCGIDLICSIICESHSRDKEMWDSIFPIITLALGYIFGSGKKQE